MPDAEQQARIVCGLALDVMRTLHAAMFKGERWGARADDLTIFFEVWIGRVEGRAPGASKIEDMTGIPRTSVIRKAREMEAQGLIERVRQGYGIPAARLDDPATLAALARCTRMVRRAADALARLDAE
jgi:hypothetical protein